MASRIRVTRRSTSKRTITLIPGSPIRLRIRRRRTAPVRVKVRSPR